MFALLHLLGQLEVSLTQGCGTLGDLFFQALFNLFLVIDISAGPKPAYDSPFFVARGDSAPQVPAKDSARVAQAIFNGIRFTSFL